MPKKMQIEVFKRLFLIWNKNREKKDSGFCAVNHIDLVDWEGVLDEKLNFHENLDNLADNYPEYNWKKETTEGQFEKMLEEFQAEQMAKAEAEYQTIPEEELPEDLTQPDINSNVTLNQLVLQRETENEKVYSIKVEILPHQVKSKGQSYLYGRIQLSVNPAWIGLNAKISIIVPNQLEQH